MQRLKLSIKTANPLNWFIEVDENEQHNKRFEYYTKDGIEALTKKLDPVGMPEFIRQLDFGYGDSKEHHEQLNDIDIYTIEKKAEARSTSKGIVHELIEVEDE